MGAPAGNTNSSVDNRLWANTIRRAIAQGDPEKLRKIADKLLAMAELGDLGAIKEVGDRLDGRSQQTVNQKHEHRFAETISEEHARLVAEGFLESLRGREISGSPELGGLHGGDAPGLSGCVDTSQDS